MRRRSLPIAAATLLACGLGLTAPAYEVLAQAETALTAPAVSFPDADFVLKAGQSNAEEVALGDLARRQAKDPDVKMFGHHMVRDHGKALEELVRIASKKGIPLPRQAVERIVRTQRAILAARSGPKFDREYIKQQVASHKVALTLFRFAADNASDEAIRAYARKYKPVIEEHLKHAEALLKDLAKIS